MWYFHKESNPVKNERFSRREMGKAEPFSGIPGQRIKKFQLCQLFGVFFRLIIETEERIKTCQGESRCKRTGERQASEDGGDRCSGPGIRNSVGQTDGIMIM